MMSTKVVTEGWHDALVEHLDFAESAGDHSVAAATDQTFLLFEVVWTLTAP